MITVDTAFTFNSHDGISSFASSSQQQSVDSTVTTSHYFTFDDIEHDDRKKNKRHQKHQRKQQAGERIRTPILPRNSQLKRKAHKRHSSSGESLKARMRKNKNVIMSTSPSFLHDINVVDGDGSEVETLVTTNVFAQCRYHNIFKKNKDITSNARMIDKQAHVDSFAKGFSKQLEKREAISSAFTFGSCTDTENDNSKSDPLINNLVYGSRDDAIKLDTKEISSVFTFGSCTDTVSISSTGPLVPQLTHVSHNDITKVNVNTISSKFTFGSCTDTESKDSTSSSLAPNLSHTSHHEKDTVHWRAAKDDEVDQNNLSNKLTNIHISLSDYTVDRNCGALSSSCETYSSNNDDYEDKENHIEIIGCEVDKPSEEYIVKTNDVTSEENSFEVSLIQEGKTIINYKAISKRQGEEHNIGHQVHVG